MGRGGLGNEHPGRGYMTRGYGPRPPCVCPTIPTTFFFVTIGLLSMISISPRLWLPVCCVSFATALSQILSERQPYLLRYLLSGMASLV